MTFIRDNISPRYLLLNGFSRSSHYDHHGPDGQRWYQITNERHHQIQNNRYFNLSSQHHEMNDQICQHRIDNHKWNHEGALDL